MDRRITIGRSILAALALAAIGATAVPAPAQQDPIPGEVALAAADDLDLDDDGPGFGPGGGRFGDRMARRLDLSDAQREAIAKIHQDGRERDLPLRKQLRLLRHELQGEMMKDSPSEKAVLALAGKMGEVRTKLQSGRLADRLAVRAQLTDEQRDRMLAMGGPGGRGFGGRGFGGPGFDGPRGGRHGGGRGMRGGPGCDGDGPDGDGPRGDGPGRGPRGQGPRWQQDAD